MIAVTWESIAVGYALYLAITAMVSRQFHRARRWTLVAAFASWTVWASAIHMPRMPVAEALVPVPVLLAGYWLSGLFFVSPMPRLEESLLRIDERIAHRWAAACPPIVREYFELAYLLVYAVVPAGALTLVFAGHAEAVPRFWAVVLLAEFVSYGMLPWLQTRPPRAIEGATPATTSSALRRFNEAVLQRGSIQVNTLPSGHAAGAVATGLAVASAMPIAGLVFLVLAASIAIATVAGRYHYTIDSVLGVAVAIAAWLLIG